MAKTLRVDIESYSAADIKKVGLWAYAHHPSTEILMAAYSIDGGPTVIWSVDDSVSAVEEIQRLQATIRSIAARGRSSGDRAPGQNVPPLDLIDALLDPTCEKRAFNAPFEFTMFEAVWGIPARPEEWRCTMIEALSLGFPAGLDDSLEAVGLEKKDARGKALINTFSKPAPSNHIAARYSWLNKPEEWQAFKDYCVKDVVVEWKLAQWMAPYRPMAWDGAWQEWFLDQKIQRRGVRVDADYCRGALAIWSKEKARLKSEFLRVTGLDKMTRDPFLAWLNGWGLAVEDTRKETLDELAETLPEDSPFRYVIDCWQGYASRAMDKFTTALRMIEGMPDDRLRYVIQFGAASRTFRYGGRGFQIHNLKRSKLKAPEEIAAFVDVIRSGDPARLTEWEASQPDGKRLSVAGRLSTGIRHAIRADDGKMLVPVDYGSIESRYAGWLCGCTNINRVFAEGKDTYRDFAAPFFGVQYDEVTGSQRTFAKPIVLGAVYLLGPARMVEYAKGYGVTLSFKDAKRAIKLFREINHEIPEFWEWVGDAIAYVVRTGQPLQGYGLALYMDGPFFVIRLRSGRELHYFRPAILPKEISYTTEVRRRERAAGSDDLEGVMQSEELDAETGEWVYMVQRVTKKDAFTYMGMDDKNRWVRIDAHPGGILENIVQADCRDLLQQTGINPLEEVGGQIVFHVHDEPVMEVPGETAQQWLDYAKWRLCQMPPWAHDMLMGAEGYVSKHYMKD